MSFLPSTKAYVPSLSPPHHESDPQTPKEKNHSLAELTNPHKQPKKERESKELTASPQHNHIVIIAIAIAITNHNPPLPFPTATQSRTPDTSLHTPPAPSGPHHHSASIAQPKKVESSVP
ncbi:hypothetical protein J1614_001129 [Plenodomus biglobosus]|nr:hypothetical protein J1614_001129 [Plenodomus biglobosus]